MVDSRAQVDVCLVVVNHNSLAVVTDLLDSIPGSLRGCTFRTIVVDNGSTDDSVSHLSVRADIQLVRSDNVGYAAGINKGVAAGPATRAMLILNPDTRLLPGSATRMLHALDRSGVGIVAPRVLNPDGSLEFSLRREPSVLRALGLSRTGLAVFCENLTDPEDYERAHIVDWALGAALMVSKDCFEALGGWDESYFLYSEETDFCLRARDLGFATWYEPTATVIHVGGASGRNTKTQILRAMNSVRLFRRSHGRPSSYTFWFLTMLREVLWAVKRRDFTVVKAMWSPTLRPSELNASRSLLPD